MHLRLSKAILAGALCALLAASVTEVSRADGLQLRAGSASSRISTDGTGGWGVGIGYQHDLADRKLWKLPVLRRSTLGVQLEYGQLARFGNAVEIEVPLTLELLWHFQVSQNFLPYYGIGGGGYYRKLRNTGDDRQFLRDGWHLALGTDVPIGNEQQLGLDARFAFTDSNNGVANPAFGLGTNNALHWGVKATWTLRYDVLPGR